MPAPELLQQLLTAAGPSGHETDPARVWRDGCAGFAQEVRADHVGSSLARVAARPGAVPCSPSSGTSTRSGCT